MLVFALATIRSAPAQITNWQTGNVIPGTEAITVGPLMILPGIHADAQNLRFADLAGRDLHESIFLGAWLDSARFNGSNLSAAVFRETTLESANFSNANLSNARMYDLVDLTNANFAGADIRGVEFARLLNGVSQFSAKGLTKEQIYTTASYLQRNLQDVALEGYGLIEWDLSHQDLSGMRLRGATLVRTSFVDALINNVDFSATMSLTAEQLYSTASYQQKNLRGVKLNGLNLASWDLSGQNLDGVQFVSSTLKGASFVDANIINTTFASATPRQNGLTAEQLYSTASYKTKSLQGIYFYQANLSGWNFRGQDLSRATLSQVQLSGADFTDANIANATFESVFSKEQLYSTASYKDKNLSGLSIIGGDLSNWNLAGQNLMNAHFSGLVWSRIDLSFADFRNADFAERIPLSGITRNAIFQDGTIAGLNILSGERLVVRDFDAPIGSISAPTSITVKNQVAIEEGGFLKLEFDADSWDSTIFFRPGINVQLGGTLELDFANGVDVTSQAGRAFSIFHWAGVTPTGQFTVNSPYNWDLSQLYTTGQIVFQGQVGLAGDFDHDGTISAQDIDRLSQEIRSGTNTAAFDLNGDTLVNSADRTVWVHDLRKTYFGDANLDGLFNTNDLVSVFQAGQYEDTIAGNSSWATGDWDGNGDFTTSDLVAAFQDGGYEQGPRNAAATTAAVPEPGAAIGLIAALGFWRRRSL